MRDVPIHSSITLDRVMRAVEAGSFALGDPGFCIACGADACGVEPDARLYFCEACGEMAVFGAEELMFMLDRATGA